MHSHCCGSGAGRGRDRSVHLTPPDFTEKGGTFQSGEGPTSRPCTVVRTTVWLELRIIIRIEIHRSGGMYVRHAQERQTLSRRLHATTGGGGLASKEETPSALRWLIGVELEAARGKTTRKSVAQALGVSEAKIQHMETGARAQSPEDVADVMRFLGASQADIDRLSTLASSADNTQWWAPWSDVVPDWLRTRVGLEQLCRRQITYKSDVFPAAAQTPEYALGVTAGSSRVRPDSAERIVDARMERKSRLFGENPMHLVTIIEEHALDRPIGGPTVMRKQLEHLLELLQLPNFELFVLPLSVGSHDGLETPFAIMEFEHAQSIAYVEHAYGAIYLQRQDQVRGYTHISEQLREVARSDDQVVEMIEGRLAART